MINQAEIHRKVHSKRVENRMEVAKLFRESFRSLQDKSQAWQDLIDLTLDEDEYVRWEAANALNSAIQYLSNKELALKDLMSLTHNEDKYVRWWAAESLGSVIPYLSNRDQAWQDLHKLALDEDKYVRRGAANALGSAFQYLSNRDQAWQDLHNLTHDKDRTVRWVTAYALGSAIQYLSNKEPALRDLHRLTQDEDEHVRWGAAESLGSVFQYLPNRDLAWQDLQRLTLDRDSGVRLYAYHSLGKASVLNATESEDINSLRKNLGGAVEYFEKSAQESEYSPARFCHPFYRCYLAMVFQEAPPEAVQNYLSEARKAIGGSESKEELLEAVENLAGALREAQRTKDMQLVGMQCDLYAYMRYCNHATDCLRKVEKDAPAAVNLILKGFPSIDQQIKEIIGSIQEKAHAICIQGKGTGTVLEAAGLELNRWAKELSSKDILKSERSCSRIEYTLQEFCSRIPVDKRSPVCELIKEIGLEEQLQNKLTKIELVLRYILNEWPDYNVIKKLDEIHCGVIESDIRLHNKTKVEIIDYFNENVTNNIDQQDSQLKALEQSLEEIISILEKLPIDDIQMNKVRDAKNAVEDPKLSWKLKLEATFPLIAALGSPAMLKAGGEVGISGEINLRNARANLIKAYNDLVQRFRRTV